ncbi:MAG TPA: 3'-5' exonuclease [Solirubrobacteraceae bacterium]|nr:3'-5' exonuclease [Solirubrobacteraceae bacterium]
MKLLAPREGAAAEFARAGRPPEDLPWRQARFCALDLELTGLDQRKNDIIAIGAVPIEDGRVVLGDCMYTLVRTTKRSEHEAVLVHKLRVPDLVDAPPLDEAVDMVLEVLSGSVPVFHTAWVEQSFLGPLLRKRRVRLPAPADTEVLGRVWLRARDGHAPQGLSLEYLSSLLGQPVETPHHALGDALTTAKAFIALATHLDAPAPQTVGSLVATDARTQGPRRFGAG